MSYVFLCEAITGAPLVNVSCIAEAGRVNRLSRAGGKHG
jgi:hypothetical protein